MPSVLLARHAQGSFGGANYDVLSDHGHEQARALRDSLREREVRIDRVVCGTLARQRDTAAPIAEAYGLEVAEDERWNEYRSEDILRAYGNSDARLDGGGEPESTTMSSRDFQALLDVALHAWIAAGDDGEGQTHTAFAAGAGDALRDVLGGLGSGETALVVSSGGVIAALCVALMELPADAFVTFNRVTVNASCSKIVHGRGGTTLVSFNEHAHLERAGSSLVTYR